MEPRAAVLRGAQTQGQDPQAVSLHDRGRPAKPWGSCTFRALPQMPATVGLPLISSCHLKRFRYQSWKPTLIKLAQCADFLSWNGDI